MRAFKRNEHEFDEQNFASLRACKSIFGNFKFQPITFKIVILGFSDGRNTNMFDFWMSKSI